MKKLTIIILSLLFWETSYPNESFIDSLKTWNIAYNFVNSGAIDPHDYWTTESYKMVDNVKVNNINYKKMVSYNDSIAQQEKFKFYVREDSIGKIYYANDETEFVAFDFNLNVGDSMLIIPTHQGIMLTSNFWAKIDSIANIHLNGISYKAQYLTIKNYDHPESDFFNDIWINEIGSLTYGLFYPVMGITASRYVAPRLLCVSKNEILLYKNPEFDACYINTKTAVTTLENQAKLIEVFSCDVGTLMVKSPNQQQGKFTLYNTEGKQLIKQNINAIETQICLPQSGVFIYQFTSNKGEVQSGKVMVK